MTFTDASMDAFTAAAEALGKALAIRAAAPAEQHGAVGQQCPAVNSDSGLNWLWWGHQMDKEHAGPGSLAQAQCVQQGQQQVRNVTKHLAPGCRCKSQTHPCNMQRCCLPGVLASRSEVTCCCEASAVLCSSSQRPPSRHHATILGVVSTHLRREGWPWTCRSCRQMCCWV